jgi:hypothetical protein
VPISGQQLCLHGDTRCCLAVGKSTTDEVRISRLNNSTTTRLDDNSQYWDRVEKGHWVLRSNPSTQHCEITKTAQSER